MDRLLTSGLDGSLKAAPGVVVGILLILAAICWFSPVARYRLRRLTLWLVVAAVALIIIYGYLGFDPGDGV